MLDLDETNTGTSSVGVGFRYPLRLSRYKVT